MIACTQGGAAPGEDGRALVLLVIQDPELEHFVACHLVADYDVVRAVAVGDELVRATARPPELILVEAGRVSTAAEEVVRGIRAIPDLAATPLIVLTPVADPTSRGAWLQRGAQDHLLLPCVAEELVSRVAIHVTLKRVRDLLQAQGHDVVSRVRELADRQRHLARLLRANDEFLATVSHELRTPLAPIIGWASLLRMGTLGTSEATRAIETIERCAQLEKRLVDDLLDISRIVAGKMRLDERELLLPPIIDAALESARLAARAKGIELRIEITPDVGAVRGDPDRLQQIVWNLVTNAVKFTPDGGSIEVRLEQRGSQAVLSVTDTGEGISPDFLPHVFERFQQEDSSSTRSHGGLGIGLALVRHLVDLHGGMVRVESSGSSQGARFVVLLPLVEGRPRRVADADRSSAVLGGARHALAGRRILVVDDEPDACDVVARMLEVAGAEVYACGSVAEALKTYERWRPDVVVSDIAMPGDDGYVLLRRLRARQRRERRATPVVALTAHARTEDRARALAAGFQLYMSKPVEPTRLVTAVESLVSTPGSDGPQPC